MKCATTISGQIPPCLSWEKFLPVDEKLVRSSASRSLSCIRNSNELNTFRTHVCFILTLGLVMLSYLLLLLVLGTLRLKNGHYSFHVALHCIFRKRKNDRNISKNKRHLFFILFPIQHLSTQSWHEACYHGLTWQEIRPPVIYGQHYLPSQ